MRIALYRFWWLFIRHILYHKLSTSPKALVVGGAESRLLYWDFMQELKVASVVCRKQLRFMWYCWQCLTEWCLAQREDHCPKLSPCLCGLSGLVSCCNSMPCLHFRQMEHAFLMLLLSSTLPSHLGSSPWSFKTVQMSFPFQTLSWAGSFLLTLIILYAFVLIIFFISDFFF